MSDPSKRPEVAPVVQGVLVFAVIAWAMVFLGEWVGDVVAGGR